MIMDYSRFVQIAHKLVKLTMNKQLKWEQVDIRGNRSMQCIIDQPLVKEDPNYCHQVKVVISKHPYPKLSVLFDADIIEEYFISDNLSQLIHDLEILSTKLFYSDEPTVEEPLLYDVNIALDYLSENTQK